MAYIFLLKSAHRLLKWARIAIHHLFSETLTCYKGKYTAVCVAAALTLEEIPSPVSERVPGMACTWGYQRTWLLWFACYHQSDPKWLPWHHHYLFSRMPYAATTLKKAAGLNCWGVRVLYEGRGWGRLAKCAHYGVTVQFTFLTHIHPLSYPLMRNPHSSHPPPCLYLSLLSPWRTPDSSSMCWGQSQIYNNCQSQGWQIN